jgi:hypothetical protein
VHVTEASVNLAIILRQLTHLLASDFPTLHATYLLVRESCLQPLSDCAIMILCWTLGPWIAVGYKPRNVEALHD